jgi:cephalosporin-C deacetylase-like acetyl esterase
MKINSIVLLAYLCAICNFSIGAQIYLKPIFSELCIIGKPSCDSIFSLQIEHFGNLNTECAVSFDLVGSIPSNKQKLEKTFHFSNAILDTVKFNLRGLNPDVFTAIIHVYFENNNYTEQFEFAYKQDKIQAFIKIEYPTANHIINILKDSLITIQPVFYLNNSDAHLIFDIINDVGKTEMHKELHPQNQNAEKINISDLKPGFYDLNIMLINGPDTVTSQSKFGYMPEKIEAKIDSLPDLETYWARAKRELSLIKPNFKLRRMDNLSNKEREIFLVEMKSLENITIRGWYSVPAKKGKYPVIIRFPGLSSCMTPSNFYNIDGYAEFLLNTRGHGNSCDEINPGFGIPGYYGYYMNDIERYIYKGAYMDCIRAVDFVCSRNEIDTTKVTVMGGSQGGRLAFVTAALDPKRIGLCIANVPGFCDFDALVNELRPGIEDYFLRLAKPKYTTSLEQTMNVLRHIDMKNLAPFIKCPVLIGMGLYDLEHAPRIILSAYNNISAPKELLVCPYSGHWLPVDYLKKEIEWIKEMNKWNIDHN